MSTGLQKPLVPDVLLPGLKLVLCGTAPGAESARQKAYYAKAGNQFWPVLHRVGLTPREFSPQEYALLPSYGIGLTDLCKTAYGNDDQLPHHALDREALEHKIKQYTPKWLAFTSKNAASAALMHPVRQVTYGVQTERIGATRLFVLPSTSGQARRWWREEVWEDLAQRVCAT